MLKYIVDTVPVGVLCYDHNMNVILCNRTAERFLRCHAVPSHVLDVCRRMFDAAAGGRLSALFPGEVRIIKRFDGSHSNWMFRLAINEHQGPTIAIFIIEESVSSKLDISRIRGQYKLTRRETDLLRRVIDGLNNREVAHDLGITEQTVKDHLSNIYTKMGIKNRFALVRFLLDSSELYLE